MKDLCIFLLMLVEVYCGTVLRRTIGERVILNCSHGSKQSNLMWYKDRETLLVSYDNKTNESLITSKCKNCNLQINSHQSLHLILENVSLSDTGIYSCKLSVPVKGKRLVAKYILLLHSAEHRFCNGSVDTKRTNYTLNLRFEDQPRIKIVTSHRLLNQHAPIVTDENVCSTTITEEEFYNSFTCQLRAYETTLYYCSVKPINLISKPTIDFSSNYINVGESVNISCTGTGTQNWTMKSMGHLEQFEGRYEIEIKRNTSILRLYNLTEKDNNTILTCSFRGKGQANETYTLSVYDNILPTTQETTTIEPSAPTTNVPASNISKSNMGKDAGKIGSDTSFFYEFFYPIILAALLILTLLISTIVCLCVKTNQPKLKPSAKVSERKLINEGMCVTSADDTGVGCDNVEKIQANENADNMTYAEVENSVNGAPCCEQLRKQNEITTEESSALYAQLDINKVHATLDLTYATLEPPSQGRKDNPCDGDGALVGESINSLTEITNADPSALYALSNKNKTGMNNEYATLDPISRSDEYATLEPTSRIRGENSRDDDSPPTRDRKNVEGLLYADLDINGMQSSCSRNLGYDKEMTIYADVVAQSAV